MNNFIFQNRYQQTLIAILFSFIILTAIRLFLYFKYPVYFSNLNANELILSLFMGLRIDYAVLSVFTSLYWFFLLLPFKLVHNITYRKTVGTIWGITFATIAFYNIADVMYFGYVDRHITNEIYQIHNDIYTSLDMVLNLYSFEIFITFFFSFAIVYFFYKLFSFEINNITLNKKEWLILPLILILIILGIRGKISGKPFTTSDAFSVKKLSSGNLALSGTYILYRSKKNINVNRDTIPVKEAILNVKKVLQSNKFEYTNPIEYPLLRKLKNPDKKNYNVVIVLIESLSAKYLDVLSKNNYGVTPTLDKLASQGQLYTNFYASGQRSQDAITTIYSGLTQPVGFNSIGSGLELYGLSYLGDIAAKEGYSTLAMQSSKRSSFRVDAVSEIAGFEEYYGAEDIPHVGEEKGSPQFGTWDGNSFKFLHKKLNTLKEPFLSFFFTSSTHAPFFLPHKKYEKYSHSNKSENGYLNTLYYVDQQINEFISKAKRETWFKNTIFIFSADHEVWSSSFSQTKKIKKDNVLKGYHIPLIIYSPGILKPLNSNIIASQNDIIVSLIDLLGFKTEFSVIANSIFDTSVQTRFAHVKKGNIIGLNTVNGSIFYNFKEFIPEEKKTFNEEKNILLSIDKTQAYLLKNDMWSK